MDKNIFIKKYNPDVINKFSSRNEQLNVSNIQYKKDIEDTTDYVCKYILQILKRDYNDIFNMIDTNGDDPAPSIVVSSNIVGIPVVFQHTPLLKIQLPFI